jgi:hypothetical protein
MEWLKKAPSVVVICFFVLTTVLALATLAAYVVLSVYGNPQDLADFRQWVQTIGIAVVVPLLGVNTVATWAGARSASNAEDNTDGSKDAQIAALRAELARKTGGAR